MTKTATTAAAEAATIAEQAGAYNANAYGLALAVAHAAEAAKQAAAGDMNRAANEALRVCEISAKDTVNRPKTANLLPPLRHCAVPALQFGQNRRFSPLFQIDSTAGMTLLSPARCPAASRLVARRLANRRQRSAMRQPPAKLTEREWRTN